MTTTYDAFDRPLTVTYPDGTTEEMTYDRLDLVESKDRLGRRTRFVYDALRRLVATRDALGRTVTRQWCICGSLDALIDAKGQRTRWERDLQARILQEIRHDGVASRTYTYEQTIGRIKTLSDAKLQVATFSYNSDDTVQSIVYTNASIPTATISYTYDTNYPRLGSMTDGVGTTTYAYKPVGVAGAGSVASVDGPFANDTVTYDYDELARVSIAVNGVGTTASMDALGRIDAEVTPIGTFTTTYDGTSERTSVITYPNGQTSTFTYLGNLGDRGLESLLHQLSGGATLSRSAYTYDAAHRITTWEQQAGAAAATVLTAAYDDADELARASIAAVSAPATPLKRYAYRYDAASNRTSAQVDDATTQSTYDALNRLTERRDGGPIRIAGSVNEPATVTVQGAPATTAANGSFQGQAQVASGTTVVTIGATDASGNTAARSYEIDAGPAVSTYTYDANGNMLSDGVRTFEWDAKNRVVSITEGTKRSEFTYDGSSRMVRLVELQSAVITEERTFVWCGTELCERRDASGATVQVRFFKHGFQEAGVAYFYARDHLSSVREVTDGTGAVRARYEYDPFGRMTKVAGDYRSPIGYSGMYIHEASGLNLTLFRVYDASLGRWISEDPIGFGGGLNLYAYVENRPFTHVDPLGLQCVVLARVPSSFWKLLRTSRDPTSTWTFWWSRVEGPEMADGYFVKVRPFSPFGRITCYWRRKVHVTRWFERQVTVFGACLVSCYKGVPQIWSETEKSKTEEDITDVKNTERTFAVGDTVGVTSDNTCMNMGPPGS